MNRKETKLLVESWRGYINESNVNESLDDTLSAVSAVPKYVAGKISDKFKNTNSKIESANRGFAKIVKDYAESFKKMDPNKQALGNNQSIRSNKIYGNLWNSFWSTFSTKNAKKYKDMCVWNFFDHLKKICQSGESKNMFNNAFKVLLHVNGAGFAAKLIEMLFNDYMSNMRGSSEDYCWETDEEAFHLYSEFQDKLKDLKRQGFNLKTGECHYLKS